MEEVTLIHKKSRTRPIWDLYLMCHETLIPFQPPKLSIEFCGVFGSEETDSLRVISYLKIIRFTQPTFQKNYPLESGAGEVQKIGTCWRLQADLWDVLGHVFWGYSAFRGFDGYFWAHLKMSFVYQHPPGQAVS